MFSLVQSAAAQGILWGIMTIGVYLTYKVLNYSDLTVDGSFALGGAVSASLIVGGMHPVPTLLVSIFAGMIAGCVTGLLHTALKIPPILSGILTMLALYSINISIMGKPNTALLKLDTIFTLLKDKIALSNDALLLWIGGSITICIILFMYWFFGTEIGSAIRATGSNEAMVRALGSNTNALKILCLMLSNGLVALAGGLIAQSQGAAEVTMGTGAIIMGLASVIIGEVAFGANDKLNFAYKLLTVVLGSIVYRLIIAVVLELGLKASNLNLLTAILVASALSLPVLKKRFAKKARRITKC